MGYSHLLELTGKFFTLSKLASLTCFYAKHNSLLYSFPGSGATIQGIIHGVYWGLGMAVGGVIGGMMVHVIGARLTFRLEAAFSFAILVLFFAVNNVHEKSTRYSQIPSEPQENGDFRDKAADQELESAVGTK